MKEKFLKEFYAKVWDNNDTYYIKYISYYHPINDNYYYKAALELYGKEIPSDSLINKMAVWGSRSSEGSSPLNELRKCNSIGEWESDYSGRMHKALHAFYQTLDLVIESHEDLKAYGFKYLGSFKDYSLDAVKLLIECDIER